MWTGIETAPTDGTKILGYDPDYDGCIAVMRYIEAWGEGWINADYDAVQYSPTHWMPLPERPLTDEEENMRWGNPLIL